MIDNYLLEELVTFADEKTLAKTAQKLLITQPTVTRGMQKLESELGVKLFDRQPNRIELTDTGKKAVEGARQILQANRDFITDLQNYDQRHRAIRLAAVAPGPLLLANSIRRQHLTATPLQINPHFVLASAAEQLLTDNQYSLIVTNHEVQTDRVESLFLGQEHLQVNLDQFMYLAGQQAVAFKELAGISFIVLNDIGPWKKIIQSHIPNAKFLYQEQRAALAEITRYSNFPYFSTNITGVSPSESALLNNTDRVTLPITDPAATMTFYAAYLKENRKLLRPFLKLLIKKWPQGTQNNPDK